MKIALSPSEKVRGVAKFIGVKLKQRPLSVSIEVTKRCNAATARSTSAARPMAWAPAGRLARVGCNPDIVCHNMGRRVFDK